MNDLNEQQVKARLRFINSARSDDKTRLFLAEAYWHEGKLIATDGRRLHIWKVPEEGRALYTTGLGAIESGKFVRIDAKNAQVFEVPDDFQKSWSFPNYERVDPDYNTHRMVQIDMTSPIDIAQFMINNKIAINYKYVEHLQKLNTAWTVKAAPDDGYANKALTFDWEDCHAVIMPCQLDGDEYLFPQEGSL